MTPEQEKIIKDWKAAQCAFAWNGHCVYGDKASIEAVQKAVHAVGIVPELRARLASLSTTKGVA